MKALRFCGWFAGFLLALLTCNTSVAATQVLTVNTNGSGRVNRNPTNTVVPQGAVVTLTAIPSTNWMFSFWSGDASGSINPLNVTMDRDKTITANFSPIPSYTLTVTVSGQGEVSPSGGSYPSNAVVSLTAMPHNEWVFDRWTGSATGNANPLDITMNGHKAVTAVFVQPPIILSHPQSVSASGGDNVMFRVIASGTAPLSYAWQFNGANIPAATATNLMLTNVQPANAGHYRAVVTNSGGSTTSQIATLTVDCDGSNAVTVCNESELRQAIARGGKVQFCCSGTIYVTQTIEVTNNVELDGGRYDVAISGSNSVRMFKVSSNVIFTVANLSLVNGRFRGQISEEGSGGAIYNDGGSVRLISCVLSNNSSFGYIGFSGGASRGGAVFSRGGVVLLDGVVAISNSAVGGYGQVSAMGGAGLGGVIYGGSLTAANSSFVGNTAVGAAPGEGAGGALAGAALLITRSSFVGNEARGGSSGPGGAFGSPRAGPGFGGAVWAFGTALVSRCNLRANFAMGGNGYRHSGPCAVGSGGAVYNSGVIDVRDTTFSTNAAYGGGGSNGSTNGQGGGLFNGGTAYIHNTTFEQNVARGGSGANIGPPPGITYPGASGEGGAILNAGTMFGTNCTFALNRVEAGPLQISWTAAPGRGGGASGGGLQNVGGSLYMINVTVASNMTVRSHSSPPGQGANLANSGGTLALRNSLVAYSVGLSNEVSDPVSPGNASGAVTDGGFNISSDGSCEFSSGSSFNFTDPRLGPLRDNGGPTLTMRPLANSPAIDFGTADGAPMFDQRGARRPAGAGVDMGAFEVGPIAPILTVQRNSSMLDVSFTAEAGISYQLRSSTNLVTWQLHEAVASAPTNRAVFRSIPISGQRRFFRVQ